MDAATESWNAVFVTRTLADFTQKSQKPSNIWKDSLQFYYLKYACKNSFHWFRVLFENYSIKLIILKFFRTHMKMPASENSTQFKELQRRVLELEEIVKCLTEKVDDLAIVCVDACKDRIGIKESVANLLVVVANELGDQENEEEENWLTEVK
jgi:hypothetical protein